MYELSFAIHWGMNILMYSITITNQTWERGDGVGSVIMVAYLLELVLSFPGEADPETLNI